MPASYEKICPVAECGATVNVDNFMEHLVAYKKYNEGIMLAGNVPLSESHERWALHMYRETWQLDIPENEKWERIAIEFISPEKPLMRLKQSKWLKNGGKKVRCSVCHGKVGSFDKFLIKNGKIIHDKCQTPTITTERMS